ncbi:nicotinate phosphoribosyltransferase [Suttonella ornithocola]|uniref:Nicotinate phosphoribosyltransferase n=1 Tax=Suttonella ornithocola TaxID=279832 RepID=A0A380MNC2_9GAMM|nr:nicotinate phosphoribosyltransferase [Suttonella ornithocola]SUO94130.1 nicotinate phosphoribosyltransferase [Suttonella ornithocola]
MGLDNRALLMDFYALTMANTHFVKGRAEQWAVFDYYFRRVPEKGGFAVFAGLETLLDILQDFHFTDDDIAFLRAKGGFDEDFLNFLSTFHFRGEIYAFDEGTVIFPNEPVVTVHAPLIDCHLIETILLLTLNHQSLIATKAARICSQAQGRTVLEFGSRRAHGSDAALYGARAAFIGGVEASANTLAEAAFGVPARGTMAHAFVQSFEDEFSAFKAYAEVYPDNTILLVDTYDTLKSGVPNAIRTHQEVLAPMGKKLQGIRLDSGDLAYLSRQARKMLDAAGLTDVKIAVSNGLDEFLIKDLLTQEAAIDIFGVGERLITARSEPVFGGVYKIVALEENGLLIPKIKVSGDTIKTSTPGFKQVWRFYDTDGMATADVVSLRDEVIDEQQPYLLFDPISPWKKKHVRNFYVRPLLNLVYQHGKRCKVSPTLAEVQQHREQSLAEMWSEVKRLENPHGYYVDLSRPLWELKQSMLAEISGENE